MKDYKSIGEYIADFPKEVQRKLQEIRKIIKEEFPNSEEKISYKMPAFMLNDKFFICFAGWKSHISIYPFSKAAGKAIKESAKYKTSGKGTIQFPLNQPLPTVLIRKIVRFLAKERT